MYINILLQAVTKADRCIALGTFHQGSDFFPPQSIGKQCVANSIIAIIYHNEKPVNTWNTQDLDMILLNGNGLYLEKYTNQDYLLISDIPDVVKLDRKTYKITQLHTLYGLLSSPSPSFSTSDCSTPLPVAIQMLNAGERWTSAVMCLGHAAGGYSFSIFGQNDSIYICDSHSRNADGLPQTDGSSVVVLLTTHTKAITFIQYLAQQLQCTQYEMTPISVLNYDQHKATEHHIIQEVQSKKGYKTAEKGQKGIARSDTKKKNNNDVQSVYHKERVASTFQENNKSVHEKEVKPDNSAKKQSRAGLSINTRKDQVECRPAKTIPNRVKGVSEGTQCSNKSENTKLTSNRKKCPASDDMSASCKRMKLALKEEYSRDLNSSQLFKKKQVQHSSVKPVRNIPTEVQCSNKTRNTKLSSSKRKHSTPVDMSVSYKKIKLEKKDHKRKTSGTPKKSLESKYTQKNSTHNYYAEIKLVCKSSASLPLSAVSRTALTSVFYTLTLSVSLWTTQHLNNIHAMISNVKITDSMLEIKNMIQDIYIQQTMYQMSIVYTHNLCIPTSSTDTKQLMTILERFNDTKWRYILVSIGKPIKTVMTVFILGSKIFLFEPYSYIPSTLSLSTLNYCATHKSCTMYIQCIGKHLDCNNYTIKEIIVENTSKNRENHRKAQRQYQSVKKADKSKLDKERQQRHRDKSNESAMSKKYGKDMEENLVIFNERVAEGPTYVCTCCQQLWFKHSVIKVTSMATRKSEILALFEQCRTKYISSDDIEWICHTCKQSIYAGKVPKLSVYNGMGFPEKPPELDLCPLEERLVAPRIPFMQIRNLPCGSQKLVHGNIVNVPVDISPTINTLPRTLSDSYTVAVKFKRKKQYKKCAFQQEYVRPYAVWKAAEYLTQNSQLYKDLNIQIDTNWLHEQVGSQRHLRHFIHKENTSTDIEEQSENLSSDDETSHDIPQPECINEQLDSDAYSDPEDDNIIHAGAIEQHTLLDQEDLTVPSLNKIPQPTCETLQFAPGEGQKPISLFYDENAEYLAFPTIFCGQTRPATRKVPVHYSDICKYELRCVDRRAATNIPNIFFKLKKTQMKYVKDKIGLVLRRFKTKGKKYTAKDVLDDETCARIVHLDEGYNILRSLRNSPPYLQQKKKEAFAMIRQLGFPSLFISLSLAETKWYELLRALGKNVHKRIYTDAEIDKMNWQTKTDLIMKDPVTIVEYFRNRYKQFKDLVIDSHHKPIYKVIDHFRRYEFATRGSIHIHMFVFTENAPIYGQNTNEEIAAYYDHIISCSKNVSAEKQKYIKYQMHRHSRKGCRIGNTNKCRFGFPIPPMSKTQVLEPINFTSNETAEHYKNLWKKKIKKHLDEYGMGDDVDETFEEMLNTLDISEEEYITAVRTSITRPKVFMKRNPNEIRVNQYMKNIFHYWRANHDIQPVLEPHAMVQYILSYVTKAQKGMSSIMEKACNEAFAGHLTLKESVRHIGNAFLNAVETSQQEAAALLLQFPMTEMSRESVFIPTSPPDERTYLLKSRQKLQELDENSEDIQSENIISYYQKRPKTHLENCSLAEFAAQYRINMPKDRTYEAADEGQTDVEDQTNDEDMVIPLKNGGSIKRRRIARILRYVNYNIRTNMELHYRERLMLFLPWRNEERDLYGGYSTYTEHYNAKKEQILPVRLKYEKHNDSLQEAIEQVEAEDLNDESTDSEAEECVVEQTADLGFFDPERPEEHTTHDIGADIGIQATYLTEHYEVNSSLPKAEYEQLMRSLNKQQREICTHVIQHLDTSEEQIFLFLEGGAGVGKTQCAKAMHQSVIRYYIKAGENPDHKKTLKVAPTGMAAYHIGGNTIHSALYININRCEMTTLTLPVKNSLQAKYGHLQMVFIDEISMVGYEIFKKLEKRLRVIMDNDAPFGGLHIIAIGDFYQLPAVQDTPLYRMPKDGYDTLATHLFRDYFKIYSLTEIMRQKGEKRFCELLNRLRIGELTQEDKIMLESRKVSVTSEHYKQHVRHFFPLKVQCQRHNDKIYSMAKTEKKQIECHDVVLNVHANRQEKYLSIVQNMKNYNEQQGLLHILPVAVGLIYLLTVNLKTDDGLINGASCTLKHIQYLRPDFPDKPSILWVEFHDKDIGKQWRLRHRKMYSSGINSDWTPIWATTRNFSYRNIFISRKQFPMKPAAATTIHSSQGSTFKEICIDMDLSAAPGFEKAPAFAKRHLRHAHYVATSRVTSLEGLQIINFNEKLISVDEDVSKFLSCLCKNPLKLSYTPVYNLTGDIKVTYLNTSTLRDHISDVKADHSIMSSDVIILSETRLSQFDNSDNYKLPSFNGPFRNEQQLNHHIQPYHGMVSYLADKIRSLEQRKWNTNYFEATLTVFQHPSYPVVIQYLGIYVSPQATYSQFIKKLDEIIKTLDDYNIIVIMGDFNMKSITNKNVQYNDVFVNYMYTTYNMQEYIQTNTTSHRSKLDLCFSNRHLSTTTIWNYWSDHRIISASIQCIPDT